MKTAYYNMIGNYGLDLRESPWLPRARGSPCDAQLNQVFLHAEFLRACGCGNYQVDSKVIADILQIAGCR